MSGRLPRLSGVVATVDTAHQGYFIGGVVFPQMLGAMEPADAANRVHLLSFVLPFRAAVGRVITYVIVSEAASLYSVGIYRPDGSELLIDSGTFNGATTGIKQNVIAAGTLEPGPYLFAQTANTTATLQCRTSDWANVQEILNGTDREHSVIGANASSSGVLPATTGAFTRNPNRDPMAAVFAP